MSGFKSSAQSSVTLNELLKSHCVFSLDRCTILLMLCPPVKVKEFGLE